ncbi:hypothetical protein [macacine gammaherpesvirus 13]|uniref:Nuclear antigen EBNA-2 n=1 Tax=macacine gammaherpesvirus 13 TaxID=2341050 RepID=A0A3G1T4C2_9GAMA|nr:hypothetical protein QKT43_gp10 [Macaca arctoides gammaherpesvirus 1]AYA49795.1 hypothetical protein [Macaca arctoides gammaherpesvirus 1]
MPTFYVAVRNGESYNFSVHTDHTGRPILNLTPTGPPQPALSNEPFIQVRITVGDEDVRQQATQSGPPPPPPPPPHPDRRDVWTQEPNILDPNPLGGPQGGPLAGAIRMLCVSNLIVRQSRGHRGLIDPQGPQQATGPLLPVSGPTMHPTPLHQAPPRPDPHPPTPPTQSEIITLSPDSAPPATPPPPPPPPPTAHPTPPKVTPPLALPPPPGPPAPVRLPTPPQPVTVPLITVGHPPWRPGPLPPGPSQIQPTQRPIGPRVIPRPVFGPRSRLPAVALPPLSATLPPPAPIFPAPGVVHIPPPPPRPFGPVWWPPVQLPSVTLAGPDLLRPSFEPPRPPEPRPKAPGKRKAKSGGGAPPPRPGPRTPSPPMPRLSPEAPRVGAGGSPPAGSSEAIPACGGSPAVVPGPSATPPTSPFQEPQPSDTPSPPLLFPIEWCPPTIQPPDQEDSVENWDDIFDVSESSSDEEASEATPSKRSRPTDQ